MSDERDRGRPKAPQAAVLRSWWSLPALLRLLVLGLSWLALATTAEAASPCGGAGQRACCIGEGSVGACGGTATEINGCDASAVEGGSCQCSGSIFSSNSHCVQAPACGGPGQRACCLFEASFGACKDGVTEVNGCAGGEASCLCGGEANPLSIQANSHCQQATACGGPGQRACCGGETIGGEPCAAGLFQVPGCVGDCFCGGDANPLSTDSSGTCVTATPCGARGQRACCLSEKFFGGCDAGLVELPGCSGDCYCKNGTSSGMCTVIELGGISEPTSGRTDPSADAPTTAAASCPMLGYADVHLHMFADKAHGGGVLAGKPYAPVADQYGKVGINLALQQDFTTDATLVNSSGVRVPPPVLCPGYVNDVDPNNGCRETFFHGDHDPFAGDPVGSDLGTKDGAKSNVGVPTFGGWPRWSSTTHQQAYYKWLERAWQGGMRLTTMLAVTNEALCRGSKRLDGTNCQDSMKSIDDQLAEAKRFESFVDEQYGTDAENKGWFRIVYTPAEARQVIAQGKLAVVLGIEVAELFNCKFPTSQCEVEHGFITDNSCNFSSETNGRAPESSGVSACTPDYIKSQVKKYYDLGVRHVFPVHNFDNAFGAAASWQDGIEVGNRVVEDHWWETDNCWDDGYGFGLGFLTQTMIGLLKFEDVIQGWLPVRIPFLHADCNRFGLFPLGRVLTEELMKYGMLIDVDHLSNKAFDDTLKMAEAKTPKYPVIATHVLSFDLHEKEVRHERHRTKAQLERIKNVGGMVAAMLKDEVQDTGRSGERHTVDYAAAEVRDDCRYSSKTFAQAYAYAVDVMGAPVAMGSDFNGIAGHFGPRFGNEACGGDLDEQKKQLKKGDRLEYPFALPGFGTFDKQKTGDKTYDYNVDGMAHIGLLPDFVADLKKVGMASSDLDMLFRSAEGYVRVWERARQSGMGVAPPSAPSCLSVTGSYSPGIVYDNTVVSFSAKPDPSGAALAWDFGDGATASGANPQHVFTQPGTYSVTVRATDPIFGGSAEDAMTVVVGQWPYPAQIFFDAPTETPEGSVVEIGFTFNAINRFKSAACGGGIAPQSLQVTPGNINTPSTGVMVCSYPGGLPSSVDIMVQIEYPRDFRGETVWALFQKTWPIKIINLPPSIGPVNDASVALGTAFETTLQLNDVPGDPLTLTIQWGDGTQQSFSTQSGPRFVSHSYAHVNNAGETYQATVTLSDEAATATRTFQVAVIGSPPSVTLSGPDHSRVGSVESFSFFGHDPDGGSTSLTQLSCGPAGTLVRSDLLPVAAAQAEKVYFFECQFTEVNAANAVSVTYTDAEGRKASATRLVRIGSPPAILLDGPRSAVEGSVLPFFVQGYTTEGDDVTLVSIQCNSAAPVSQSPDIFVLNPNLHVFFDCRFPDGPATLTVSATVRDIDGETATTLAVNVINLPPAIASLTGPTRLVPGETGGVVIKASDPGEDRLAGTVNWGDGTSSTVGFPAAAPGAVVQATVGHIWERTGHYTVVVTVTDDDGGQSLEQTLLVDVVDITPPVVTVPAPITREAASAAGVAVGFSASATDDVDGPLTPTCTPASPSVFALGPTTVTCTATDAAGNVGSASFNVNVVDTTAPAISLSVSPDANAAGWHKDPLSLAWTVTDAVGVTGTTGCGAVSFVNDTNGTVVTCTAKDAAGNSSSKSVTVKLDRTAPAIVFGAASPAANANGWHKTDVGLGYSFSDGGSGLVPGAPTGGTLSFINEGAGLTQTVATADVAGNPASAVSPAISLDKTPPQIVGSRSPAASASGWNNSAVTVSFNCTDSLSQIAECSVPSTLGGEGPNQSQTGNARDLAGNTASATVGGINIDFTPPTVTCSNSAPVLWPPNHSLVNIQTTVTVDGGLSTSAGFTLVRVTSSEPDNGLGDGDTAGDIQGFVPGTADVTGQLRAERSGKGTGRVYSLVYEGGDLAGNRSTCTTTVTVPKSQGGTVGAEK